MAEGNGRIKINVGVLSICVLLICNIIAIAFYSGSIVTKVEHNCELISEYQELNKEVFLGMSDIEIRLAKIETILKGIE